MPARIRDEMRAAVTAWDRQWRACPTETLAGHITGCFRDWRPDLSAVGLWSMWLRYQQTGDIEQLLTELTGGRQ